MTKIALEREQTQMRIPPSIIRAFNIMLMVLGLMLSVSLLQWAVSDKFSKIGVSKSSQITSAVRERQLGCLAKNIYHEAGNEPFEGKVAVAQVTLNRASSDKFPDDVCKVIYLSLIHI